MKFTEKMQYSDKKLTDKECENLDKQWRAGFGDPKAPCLIPSSPIGKQICDWLREKYLEPVKPAHFYRQSFQEFISPIDGKAISSTSQLRDHERQYGVKQVGNDLITKKEQQ